MTTKRISYVFIKRIFQNCF